METLVVILDKHLLVGVVAQVVVVVTTAALVAVELLDKDTLEVITIVVLQEVVAQVLLQQRVITLLLEVKAETE